MKLKDKIKKIRIDNSLTQEEFGNIICVSRMAVSLYEKGIRKPDVNIVKAISDKFNIPLEFLYEDALHNKKINKIMIRSLLLILLLSFVTTSSVLVGRVIYANNKYGYNIYNDKLKVENSSDICIVKINYLEEDNKEYKVYNASYVEILKKSKNYIINRILIKDNQIDIITLTSYKRNIFARLFNPSIARKMIFHSDTPLLVING